MKQTVKLRFYVGDDNYVKPGERFIEFSPDGKTIKSIKRRTETGWIYEVEDPVEVSEEAVDDYIKTLEKASGTLDLSQYNTAGQTIKFTPSGTNKGMSEITITLTGTVPSGSDSVL